MFAQKLASLEEGSFVGVSPLLLGSLIERGAPAGTSSHFPSLFVCFYIFSDFFFFLFTGLLIVFLVIFYCR